MSTTAGAPPMTPPQAPPTSFAPRGDGEGTPQVTRNVPPKRVMVTPGSTVTYAGTSYSGGESFLIGDGPVADSFQNMGLVAIVDHEQVSEWNGKEGDEIRKSALGLVDAHHAEQGTSRTHDHGFAKYEHADGPDAEPSDHTPFRQQAASEQAARGITMAEHQDQRRKKGGQS